MRPEPAGKSPNTRFLATGLKGQRRAVRASRPCLLGILLLSNLAAHGQNTAETWVRRYNSGKVGSQDSAYKVITDAGGNAIVAGTTDDGITGADILIIKYSEAGMPLWTNRYNGPGNSADYISDIAVDGSRNVFVTGYSTDSQGNSYVTIAYSGAGVALWTNRYPGGLAFALAVDNSGNVLVTGDSTNSGGGFDYATIAYSGAGVALWTNRYAEAGASAVAVDNSGNVFVTGSSRGNGTSNDYATIAYSGAGVPLWTNCYNGPGNGSDQATAMAVDNSGNVFVTGSSIGSGSHYDYATIAYSGSGVPLWTNRYNGTFNDDNYANVVALDNNGNVFVTGNSFNGDKSVTIAYSGRGVALWTNSYNASGNFDDSVSGLAVDGIGNVFVIGFSPSRPDYTTIKYSGAGAALWTNRYSGLGNSYDQASAVAVDNSGNVFVTGISIGLESSYDYATIAYSGAGVPLWTNSYNGAANSDDQATALAVDNNGNVFITGSSSGRAGEEAYDYLTIAYSSAGVPLWTNRYNGPGLRDDQPNAVAVDNNGNVFVTGSSRGSLLFDYATIAYSAAGVPLWTNRYNGPSNGSDEATAAAVDNSGNIFVTGTSFGSGSSYDYATIAYSGAGVPLWTHRYNGPGNSIDQANAVMVNNSGNVFVTGSSRGNGTSNDYATIAYSGAGVPLWTNRYNGPGNGSDQATAMAVDNSGNVFVTGYSIDSGGNSEYATIAYSGAGVALWTNRYPGGPAPAVAADNRGNVFVTGSSFESGVTYDYVTIAYSAAGLVLWTNRYNGPGNGNDFSSAVAVDTSGNVIVTGISYGIGSGHDYATIAYSSSGVPLWTNRYNGPVNEEDRPATKSCLAIGPDGAVYVTGSSDGNYAGAPIYDYATVKYVWRVQLAIQSLTVASSSVNLTLSGPPASSWSIERALMIAGPWTNLGPSLLGPNGLGLFQDTNGPAKGAFYRAAQP